MKFCGMPGIFLTRPDVTPLPDSHGDKRVSCDSADKTRNL